MTCGLYIGIGDTSELSLSATEIPNLSTSITTHLVDLLAEVCLTYKFINSGDLPINPTFHLPLDNIGILCDVEVFVKDEIRLGPLGATVDEEFKRILEQSETHSIKFGEVPPNTEVTIKCTYVALSNLVGEDIQFVLPARLIPTRAPEQSASGPLRISLSVHSHDKFLSITSKTHPDCIPNKPLILSGGNKADAEVVIPDGLSSDLVLLLRANNPRAPRAWTSCGTRGSVLSSRMNLFIFCPPFQDTDGNEAGEVALFLDVREGSIDDMLSASLEKIPKWAHFNVWASFDGTSFAPIFESGAVPVSEENFQTATAKVKSFRVPYAGDDASLISTVQTILNSQISVAPRTLFFVTSMHDKSYVDEVLKKCVATSASTRSIVVLLNGKWSDASLPYLLTLHGGSAVRSNTQELEQFLPQLLEQYIQPTQSLTCTPTPPPTHQTPLLAPPFFHNSFYLSFLAYFDALTNSGEIEVKATGSEPMNTTENGTENNVHATVRPKETSSQAVHRMICYTLLSEVKAGLRQDISPSQRDTLHTILYSRFDYKLMTPKGESGRSLQAPERGGQSLTSFLHGPLKSMGKTSGTVPVGKATTEKLGGQSLGTTREERNRKHFSINQKFQAGEVDHLGRLKVNSTELEPTALEFGLEFIRDTLAPGRQLTQADSTALRNIVLAVIQDTSVICPDGPAAGIPVTKLKPVVQTAVREKWKPEDDAKPLWYTTDITSDRGSRSYMEDQNCVLESVNALYGLATTPRMAFFGVFDGHTGRHAAEFAKVNLPFNVLRNPNFDIDKLLKDEHTAITDGFMKTDSEFLAVAEKDDYKSGTTVVTLLLLESHLIVSNVGDSEAILCENGCAVQLSTLHNPLNEKERLRVEKFGGKIKQFGTLRVNGILAVTRSIGDRSLKEHVSSHPDVIVRKITEKDEFVILASDGLWEMVKYQPAVDFVKQECAKRASPDGASDTRSISRRLVDEAIKKESKDNITVMIIFLKHGNIKDVEMAET